MEKRMISRDLLKVKIYKSRALMGNEAAEDISQRINMLLKEKEHINIVFAAAPSQNEFLKSLAEKKVEWSRINAFHMDEYVGLNKDAPQLFGNYLKGILFDKVPFRNVHYLDGDQNRQEEECKRYSKLIENNPTDIVILGIGENTHLAFNDPHVADFSDPKIVKIIDLDERNRQQQVDPEDEICFNSLEEVPTHAITLTVPALFNATYAYAIAPGSNKAEAIAHTLNDPIQENYPSTILRKHPNAVLYIDEESAGSIAD